MITSSSSIKEILIEWANDILKSFGKKIPPISSEREALYHIVSYQKFLNGYSSTDSNIYHPYKGNYILPIKASYLDLSTTRNINTITPSTDSIALYVGNGGFDSISGGNGGTDDYNELANKPSINGHTLVSSLNGNTNLSSYLGLADVSHTHQISDIIDLQLSLDSKLVQSVADTLYHPLYGQLTKKLSVSYLELSTNQVPQTIQENSIALYVGEGGFDSISGGSGGTDNYLSLDNLPYINGIRINSNTNYNYISSLSNGNTSLEMSSIAQLDNSGKVLASMLPDYLLGQVLYGGNINGSSVATLSQNFKDKYGVTSSTLTITSSNASIYEGVYFIASADASSGIVSTLDVKTGDWVLSNGSAWTKIDNTDAVTGIKGNAESTYRIGNVNLTYDNLGVNTVSYGGTGLSTIPSTRLLIGNGTSSVTTDSNVYVSSSILYSTAGSFTKCVILPLNPTIPTLPSDSIALYAGSGGFDSISGGSGGTDDYRLLANRPTINNKALHPSTSTDTIIDNSLGYLGIQAALDGVGFVKINGTTISYDNSTYLTTITKALVESVLTGNITSHTHSQYLTAITKSMVEDVLTGNITSHIHSQYLTGNQTISLTGDITGSGTTSIVTTIGASTVTNAMLVKSSISINGSSVSLGDSTLIKRIYNNEGTKYATITLTNNATLYHSLNANLDTVDWRSNTLRSKTLILPNSVPTTTNTDIALYVGEGGFDSVSGGSGGVSTWSELANKPKYNSTTSIPDNANLDDRYFKDGSYSFSGDTGSMIMELTRGLTFNGNNGIITSIDDQAESLTITHSTLTGYKHIPSGGSTGQILKYSEEGTAVWSSEYSYTLPLATTNSLGGIKIGYSSSGKNYAVQLSSEKAFVNVPWTDTTYSAGTGISLSGTVINNSGVRSIATGTANGTISVNTNGTTANVSIYGLGSNAYTSTAYVPTTRTIAGLALSADVGVSSLQNALGLGSNAYTSTAYLPLTGGTMTGNLTAPNYLRSDGATIWHSGNDGSGSGLDADLLDGLQKTSFAQEYNYSTTARNSGWYKIKILSTVPWMLCFTIRVYQDFNYYDIVVSGYQYGSYYWFTPQAKIITGSQNSVDVKFGHDSVNNLWVAIPASDYTGLKICNITNGYWQVSDWSTKFSITNEATLSGTVDSTIIAKRPLVYDENAASATKLQTPRTIWGQSFDGSGNVSGAMTGVSTISASGNITTGGNVGIGTTSPAYKLDVAGNMRVTGNLTAPNYLRSDGATIWHSGNDGSGSGLDADLLDGKHWSDILNLGVYSSTRLNSIDDRDVAIYPSDISAGLFAKFKKVSVMDYPDTNTSYCGILHFRPYGSGTDLSGGYPIQIGNGGGSNDIYIRKGISSGSWSQWHKIYTSYNSNKSDVDWNCRNLTANGTIHSSSNILADGQVSARMAAVSSAGTSDYTQLDNLPTINNVTLTGNKTSSELSLAAASHPHLVSDISNFPTSWQWSNIANKPDLCGLPTYDSSNYKITFTADSGATLEIDLPIEAIGLTYNSSTQTLNFTGADGTPQSIPIGDLVDTYTGSTGSNIQISVSSGNVISATLLSGSVAMAQLTSAVQDIINGKAPIAHAVDANTYGIGTPSVFGHVKLSNNYATSDGTAAQGIGASSYALSQAYSTLNNKFGNYLPKSGGTMTGNILPDTYMSRTLGNSEYRWNGYFHITDIISLYVSELNCSGEATFDDNTVINGALTVNNNSTINGNLLVSGQVAASTATTASAGTSDYSQLNNKPQINNHILESGNNTLATLGIQAAGSYIVEGDIRLSDARNPLAHNQSITTITGMGTNWGNILQAAPSAYVTRWAEWDEISGKPTSFAPSAHTHPISEVTGLQTALDGKSATSHTHTFASITSKPTTVSGYGITDALTTSNYTNYTVTKTGTGASGTWGINITGNADTTKAFKLLFSETNPTDANLVNHGIAYNYSAPSYWKNAPDGMSYGSIINLGRGDTATLSIQLAFDVNHDSTDSTRKLWFRTKNNLDWQYDWKEIYHTGNFNPADYLPLSGGTMTGNLHINGDFSCQSIKIQSGNEINCIGSMYLQYRNQGNLYMCCNGGNVGIGTASPAYKLDVAGTIHSSGNITTGGKFYDSSDIRLKNIKSNLNYTLEDMREIPKVLFSWKKDKEESLYVGTIAQPLESKFNYLLSKDDKGMYAVDYDGLAVIALHGVDLLDDEVMRLKKKINKLESQILSLGGAI